MTFKMGADTAQLKFAEKLVILNDRALGMLTRIFNMKKAGGDPVSRPKLLSEKALEPAIAQIVKRFPVIDIKRNSSVFSSVNDMKTDILKALSGYYYTFVDVLELKDAILQLLTAMDANQCKLNITLNFDLTTSFLNLLVNLISLLVLLSRVEDRKIVLGLFGAAYDLAHAGTETSFPRLGQMVLDYDQPLRKIAEDLGLSYRLISSALESLRDIYFRRNISADQQRDSAMISLIANPKQILYATQTNTIACEYLSLDTMDRWIIFGVTFCNRLLSDQTLNLLYKKALQHCLTVRLFRDESIIVFPMVQTVLEPIKGHGKLLADLKEQNTLTLQTCGHLHAHRRQFLRMALRELLFLLADQPGLLGPKILFVWMGLSMARDEVLWLLRHFDHWPQLLHTITTSKKAIQKSGLQNIVVDKFLPELLFYITELRNLVSKYSDVIVHYHLDYISGYDAVLLAEILQRFPGAELTEYESLLVNSCVNSLANIQNEPIDSRALRLDWFRFQALTSVTRSAFKLQNHVNFAIAMNTTIFHLKQIYNLDEMLRETSDLSIYCFYPYLFDAHLRQSLDFPLQSRFSIAFPHIAAQFANSLHEMCPEERDYVVVDRGLHSCNASIEEICRKIVDIFAQVSEDEFRLAQSTSPQACSKVIAIAIEAQQQAASDVRMPGTESLRPPGQPVTASDSKSLYLAELCQAITSCKELHASGHVFAPLEFLMQQLEKHWNISLIRHLRQPDSEHPRRPSDMITYLNALLNALQHLDSFLNLDIVRLFQDTMLQQSQREDAYGTETLTEIYSKWYLEILLRKASTGQLLYSEHLHSFVNNTQDGAHSANFSNLLQADRYTDERELRSLAQLIGPYGVKIMEEKLVWHMSSQVTELCKIVRENKDTLHLARVNYDKPTKIKEIIDILNHGPDLPTSSEKAAKRSGAAAANSSLDMLLQRVTIIGEICAFRDLLFTALNAVLRDRVPFLMSSLASLIDRLADETQKINIGEACAASGFKLDVDLALANVVKQQANSNGLTDPEEHYNISCLLIVFVAIALPRLAMQPQTFYKPSLSVTRNNSHTIPLAVNTLIGALFFLHQRGDTGERMREFLALSSSGLLHILGANLKGAESSKGLALAPEHQSVCLLLDRLAQCSPWLDYGLLEQCLPYALIRSAYSNCCQREAGMMDKLGGGRRTSS